MPFNFCKSVCKNNALILKILQDVLQDFEELTFFQPRVRVKSDVAAWIESFFVKLFWFFEKIAFFQDSSLNFHQGNKQNGESRRDLHLLGTLLFVLFNDLGAHENCQSEIPKYADDSYDHETKLRPRIIIFFTPGRK